MQRAPSSRRTYYSYYSASLRFVSLRFVDLPQVAT
jgi:hypothetical protein